MPKRRMKKKKLLDPLGFKGKIPLAYKIEYTGTPFTETKIRGIKRRRKLKFFL